MDLSVSRFNGMLGNMGQAVAWRRASLCPCRDPFSGQARLGCPQCGGKGVIWDAPVKAVAAVAGLKLSRQWAQSGLWQQGDIVLSIPSDTPLWAAGADDRVLMTESTMPFSVVVMPDDPPLNYVISTVTKVAWFDTQGGFVAGALPEIDENGVLSWPANNGPPAGVQYTLTGRRIPEYFLFQDLPGDRAHFHGEALPRRAVLRAFDLFGR